MACGMAAGAMQRQLNALLALAFGSVSAVSVGQRKGPREPAIISTPHETQLQTQELVHAPSVIR